MVLVIGHRGAPTAHRENTLDAFAAAARAGADGVELDVRRTADDALAVHHDAVLPDGVAVSNIPADRLPGYIPLLGDVLDALRPDLLIDIEVKNAPHEVDWDPDDRVARQVAATVAGRGRAATTLVTSFNLTTIDVVRGENDAIAPAPGQVLRTGWLTLPGYDQQWALSLAAEHGHSVLLPRHESVDAALVAAAHDLGIEVWTWTVDDPADVERVVTLGVDAIITNHPARYSP